MMQRAFSFLEPKATLPPLLQPSHESEQTISRQRVYDALVQAGQRGITSRQLTRKTNTDAAVRRVWELNTAYGYVILGEKLKRNCWRWTLLRAEPWARPAVMPYRMAKRQEDERRQALKTAGNAPTGAVGRGQ